jgi:hypothetical protein
LVLLSVLPKVGCKISVSFEQIQNFKVLNLGMAKVKKLNIAVTLILPLVNYTKRLITLFLGRGI